MKLRKPRLSEFQQPSSNPTKVAAVCAACDSALTRADARRRHVPRIGVIDLCRGCAGDMEAIAELLPSSLQCREVHA